MKTENEIIASKLEERQKLWVELKQVPTNDKLYANAKALIELIEATDDWEQPEQREVVAKENTLIDGKPVNKGDTIKVYEWQFKALQRFLKLPESKHNATERVPQQQQPQQPAQSTAPGSAAAKVVALLFAFLLAFGFTAGAQTQTTVIGAPGQYWVQSIAGLSGGTNNIVGTNSFTTGVTNFTYITNANWTLVNGTPTNATTITTNQTVNVPGVLNVANYDLFSVFWGFQLTGAGSATATLTADYSPDNLNWTTAAFSASLVANGTTFVGTNLTFSLFAPGYWRLNTIAYPSATAIQTNVVVEVPRKSTRVGP